MDKDREPEEWRDVVGYEGWYAVSEVWKSVVGYEGWYAVSNIGRVRRIATGRILRLGTDPDGYLQVGLYGRGKRTNHKVAHLVADAFLPAKGPTDTVVRHLNDIKTDNRAENLARGTYSDNTQDAIRNGKHRATKGSAHYRAKLNDDKVEEVRRLYATGKFTQRELGLRFGVDRRTISQIVNRLRWKHVA